MVGLRAKHGERDVKPISLGSPTGRSYTPAMDRHPINIHLHIHCGEDQGANISALQEITRKISTMAGGVPGPDSLSLFGASDMANQDQAIRDVIATLNTETDELAQRLLIALEGIITPATAQASIEAIRGVATTLQGMGRDPQNPFPASATATKDATWRRDLQSQQAPKKA